MYKEIIKSFFEKSKKRIRIEQYLNLSDIFAVYSLKETDFHNFELGDSLTISLKLPKDSKIDYSFSINDNAPNFYNIDNVNGIKHIRIDKLKNDLYSLYIESMKELLICKGHKIVSFTYNEWLKYYVFKTEFDGKKIQYMFIKMAADVPNYLFSNVDDCESFEIGNRDDDDRIILSIKDLLRNDKCHTKIILLPYKDIFNNTNVQRYRILSKLEKQYNNDFRRVDAYNQYSLLKNKYNYIEIVSWLTFLNKEFDLDPNYIFKKYNKSFKEIENVKTENIGLVCQKNIKLCIDLLKRNSNYLYGTKYANSCVNFEDWLGGFNLKSNIFVLRDHIKILLHLLNDNFDFYNLVETLCNLETYDEHIELQISNMKNNNVINVDWDAFEDSLYENFDQIIFDTDILNNYAYDMDYRESKENNSYISLLISKYENNANNNIRFFENKDFITTLLSSEINYRLLGLLSNVDNTFVATGYFKSIEILLFNIINEIYNDIEIKDKNGTIDIKDENNMTFGRMLIFFEKTNNLGKIYNKNDVIFLIDKIKEWYKKERNGYFHKHILSSDRIEEIRKDTFILIYLIIGIFTNRI